MTAQYKGSGDPRRSLELLWRTTEREPTRGPKPGLSVEAIVEAAIALADDEGLAALTMRRVAERLSVGTMSLYTYVPGKAELLDAMLDRVYGEARFPDHTTGTWRSRLEAHAHEDWTLYQRHPWVLQVSETRALLGPNELELFESALRSVSGVGLSGREMISVISLVSGYVRGAAQVAAEAARAAELTGITDEEWWAARAPVLDEYFDASRYPTLARLELEGAFDLEGAGHDYHHQLALDAFEFGLQRVLDGIDAFISRRAEATDGPASP